MHRCRMDWGWAKSRDLQSPTEVQKVHTFGSMEGAVPGILASAAL